MDYAIHPVANIFPMMSADEIRALASDIQAHGQRQPIWLYDDQIIDGRSRYAACKLIDREPQFSQWWFQGSESLTAFVLSLNLHRRHLTASQKAAVAAEALPFFEAEAKARQATSTGGTKPQLRQKIVQQAKTDDAGKAAQLAASCFNVNRQYVQDAKKIKQADPELHEQMKSGAVSLQAAKRKIKPPRVSSDTDAAFAVLEKFKRLWQTLGDAEKQLIRDWIKGEEGNNA